MDLTAETRSNGAQVGVFRRRIVIVLQPHSLAVSQAKQKYVACKLEASKHIDCENTRTIV